MPSFRVIIVGGSIAGLTLAIILERYGIDYVLFEKHSTIAPQIGASIGLLPHGERILDQLGIFSQLETISMPVDGQQTFGPDGVALKEPEPIGDMLEELLGYRMRFLDRQSLLQLLFDDIQDKSKIHTSAELLRIDELDKSVQVTLSDGSSTYGDILVGADGVHSRTRQEIWRIAASQVPSYPLTRIKQSISCDFRCIFGISKRPNGTRDNMSFKAFHKNRSYLCVSGPNDKMYFFGFFKNSETTYHDTIPRYTASDAKALASQYFADTVFNNTTFGDLFESQTTSALVPLEEYVLQESFYKRAIVIGDSFHKMKPLTGEGGNAAIESAGLLADLLKRALDQGSRLDESTIKSIFSEFRGERHGRTKILMEGTRTLQRFEALDNWVLELLQLKIASRMGIINIAPSIAKGSTPARSLTYLHQSFRNGLVPFDQEVMINPHDRSAIATMLYIGSMVCIALINAVVYHVLNKENSWKSSDLLHAYISTTMVAVIALWVVESHRPSFLITPLFSALPYIVASKLLGWEIVMPTYFALHIFISKARPFYYPSPRAIRLPIAKALLPAFFAASSPVFMCFAIELARKRQGRHYPIVSISPLAFIGHPILVYFFQFFHRNSSEKLSIGQILFGMRDMKHIVRFFTYIFLFSSTAHLAFLVGIASRLRSNLEHDTAKFLSAELLKLGSLALTTLCWCSFVVWDLRRVNLVKVSMPIVLVVCTVGTVTLGPGAVLAMLWRWREEILEKGRHRQKEHGWKD